MLFGLFLSCAVLGGTILGFQLAMSLMGLGDDGMDGDVSDIGDALDVDVDTDVEFDADADSGETIGDLDQHADSTEGFKIISLKTIIAAVTFFGLGGMLAISGGVNDLGAVAFALVMGGAAMWCVYKLYAALYAYSGDGTVRVDNTVGCYGTVYLRIPANESGNGKVQISVQGRTMEYQAITPGELLKSGTKIVVTRVITSNTVEVEPAIETP